MKKIISCLILAIFTISLASAYVEYFQQKSDLGNGTIKDHLFVLYNKDAGLTDDHVSGDNPYEFYIWYSVYPKTWNLANLNYSVSYCEWKITKSAGVGNTPSIPVDINYTELDGDVMNSKYFVQLYDGDSIGADVTCRFENSSYNQLYLPASLQIVTPSWECKACQKYEWSLVEREIDKAKSLGDNVARVFTYIKKLFLLNFEIWLAFFWFFIIAMLFVAVGFIFMGAYFLYRFLERKMK